MALYRVYLRGKFYAFMTAAELDRFYDRYAFDDIRAEMSA